MKIGLVGFGFMGKAFLHSISSINSYYKNYITDIEIAGVVTSSKESSQLIDIGRYGISQAYQSLEAMLEESKIDSIYISSPNTFHYEQLIDAIKKNKNILCEKPFTVNPIQSKKILEESKPNKIYQMMFEYRNFPAIREIKRLIEIGEIGDIINFKASYLHGSYLDTQRPMSWRLREGGGVSNDLAPHIIDLCNFLIGEIDSINGFKRNYINKRPKAHNSHILEEVEVDDFASGLCKTKNGITGIIDVSRLSMGSTDELNLIINGTNGTLKWSLEDLNFYYYLNKNGSQKIYAINNFNGLVDFPPEKVSHGWLRAHCHSVYQFLASVEGVKLPKKEKDCVTSFEDGHKVQVALDSFKQYNSFFQ